MILRVAGGEPLPSLTLYWVDCQRDHSVAISNDNRGVGSPVGRTFVEGACIEGSAIIDPVMRALSYACPCRQKAEAGHIRPSRSP
jgi:hypothetical protein